MRATGNMLKRTLGFTWVPLVTCCILLGCAHSGVQEIEAWAVATRPQAERGEIKWSDYYREMFQRISRGPNLVGKAAAMERADVLASAALAFEKGEISRDDFESVRRQVAMSAQRDIEASNLAARAALASAIRNYAATRYAPTPSVTPSPPPAAVEQVRKPIQTNCTTFGPSTSCVSQ